MRKPDIQNLYKFHPARIKNILKELSATPYFSVNYLELTDERPNRKSLVTLENQDPVIFALHVSAIPIQEQGKLCQQTKTYWAVQLGIANYLVEVTQANRPINYLYLKLILINR